MSNLFTAVSVEQQEIVAGGLRGRVNANARYNQDKKLSFDKFQLSFGQYGPTVTIRNFKLKENNNGESDFLARVSA
jgi:hypothetical protein